MARTSSSPANSVIKYLRQQNDCIVIVHTHTRAHGMLLSLSFGVQGKKNAATQRRSRFRVNVADRANTKAEHYSRMRRGPLES